MQFDPHSIVSYLFFLMPGTTRIRRADANKKEPDMRWNLLTFVKDLIAPVVTGIVVAVAFLINLQRDIGEVERSAEAERLLIKQEVAFQKSIIDAHTAQLGAITVTLQNISANTAKHEAQIDSINGSNRENNRQHK